MRSSLIELQRQFHDAITGEQLSDAALDVVRDDGIDRRRRLEVYVNAYRIRLVDAIASEYPKVEAALGRAAFVELCRRYLLAHPTSRPSLRDAAQHLPAFLARGGFPQGPSYLADLAALERARTNAFDGADADPLRRDDLAHVAAEEVAFLQLPLVPTAALLDMASIADEVWAAIEAEVSPPVQSSAIALARTILIWRRDITVIHRTLAIDEAEVLRALAAGATFAEACEVLAQHDNPPQRALEIILTALDGAVFAALQPSNPATQPLPENLGELDGSDPTSIR